jgi:hypothetical protein
MPIFFRAETMIGREWKMIRLLGWLYILVGTASLAHVVLRAQQGRVVLDPAVLGLFVGRGLLRLDDTWRRIASVLAYVGILGTLVTSVAWLLIPWASTHAGGPPPGFVILCGATSAIAWGWSLSVLRSEPVRDAFLTRDAG